MYPISDLTTFCRKTSGDVPPRLVGASTTVVGSKMYLYGGRLVAERRMVTDIYMFDLETFNWERISHGPENDLPQARYFHSADTWNNHLIIFGGMTLQPDSANPDELYVLNDVRFFNLSTRRWLPPPPIPPSDQMVPKARYAHLSSITSNRLFIIGGQDLSNVWLDDIYVFDLRKQIWVHRRDYPRHCGTYRSVAVSSNLTVRFPQGETRPGVSISKLGPSGSRFSRDQSTPNDCTSPESLLHLPYSAAPTDEFPSDIYLFSNYNFTNVQRELELFKPSPGSNFTISDQSSAMTGSSFPPGLRFPAGAILGTHFIVAGTYLTQSYQSFSIWALDLITMTWSRIDPGSALATGSWFRSCLWPEANKFLVFGNSHGNLAADYNRRLLSWDHVACIDLEAFGIYQYPPLYASIENQELGLAAFEEGLMSDFEIICDDGRKILCSRRVLEDRWPWFKQNRGLFLQSASRAMDMLPSSSHDVPMPDFPSISKEPRSDPRLAPRSLHLSESYPVSLAFLQYLYTKSLITPLQHAPAVLSQLLLLSSTYNLSHLQSLVKHAMHRALTYATSVGIYGVSTLCNCRSLQIRALRVVMAYSQKRPAGRPPRDKEGGNESRPGGTGGGSNDGPGISGAARPRGMSDAPFIHRSTSETQQGGGQMRGYDSSDTARDVDLDTALIDDLVVSFPITPTSTNNHHSAARGSVQDLTKVLSRSDALASPDYLPSPPPSSSGEGFPSRQKSTVSSSISSFTDLYQQPTLEPVPFTSQKSLLSPIEESSSRKRLANRQQPRPSNLRIPRNADFVNNRTLSVVSTCTDQDLRAIAEIMAPMIAEFAELDREQEHQVMTEPTTPTSVWSSSLYEEETDNVSDDLCSRAHLSSSTSYPAFHLPSPFTTASYHDSYTPSLTSPTSSSSSLSLGFASSQTALVQNLDPLPDTLAASLPGLGHNSLSVIEEQDFNQDASSAWSSGSIISTPSDLDGQYRQLQQKPASSSTLTENFYTEHSSQSSSTDSSSFFTPVSSRQPKIPALARLFANNSSSKNLVKGKEKKPVISKSASMNEIRKPRSTSDNAIMADGKELAKAKRDRLANDLKALKKNQDKAAPAWKEQGGVLGMGGLVTTLYAL